MYITCFLEKSGKWSCLHGEHGHMARGGLGLPKVSPRPCPTLLCPAGRQPAAVFYPFEHPMPYAYDGEGPEGRGIGWGAWWVKGVKDRVSIDEVGVSQGVSCAIATYEIALYILYKSFTPLGSYFWFFFRFRSMPHVCVLHLMFFYIFHLFMCHVATMKCYQKFCI
jgi:hypothetical protein